MVSELMSSVKNHSTDYPVIDTVVSPKVYLNTLSKKEISRLLNVNQGDLHELFQKCALAVLSSSSYIDDGKELRNRYPVFDIQVARVERGIKLTLKNAPAIAFVGDKIIRGISENLFAVLRDIVYVRDEIYNNPKYDLKISEGITDAVFHILRNANLLDKTNNPNMVVCWGGHSITREEYDYSKEVGYQLGLRIMDICTGCGTGAMKGPMKGATIGHAKQHIPDGQYLGITEPGIIAAESPNPIVNNLVIMPDVEKRLEAFVRIAHGIVVFPGGVGTAEEILYILGILLHPDNASIPYPLIFTGPECAKEYFTRIDQFIVDTLGIEAQQRYKIIIGNPAHVAEEMIKGINQVHAFRHAQDDASYFNWLLKINQELQTPFKPTHENMRKLKLNTQQAPYLLAANLRRAFSGIVAGNVKEEGIITIEQHGNFEIQGEIHIMESIDALLKSFVEQQRMKLPGNEYIPCYDIIKIKTTV
ncbi:MAG: putative Rossmann-fold nucleotide-binding protein [Gammaproteobacteria bacterium]|jgi:predicted Rossmann-fold nucleotide-binding protein